MKTLHSDIVTHLLKNLLIENAYGRKMVKQNQRNKHTVCSCSARNAQNDIDA